MVMLPENTDDHVHLFLPVVRFKFYLLMFFSWVSLVKMSAILAPLASIAVVLELKRSQVTYLVTVNQGSSVFQG